VNCCHGRRCCCFCCARGQYRDPRRQFLLAVALFGMLLFSIPVNKLPGYILPLVPAMAALMGVALDEEADGVGNARPWLVGGGLVCSGLVLVAFPIAAAVLPEALSRGLSRVARPSFQIAWLLAAAPALGAWLLERHGKRLAAVFTVAAGVAAGVFYLKATVVPELNSEYPRAICGGRFRRTRARSVWMAWKAPGGTGSTTIP